MTALGFRDIGDMPGLSCPDTRRDDWVQRCEDHANENSGALSARCLADRKWLKLVQEPALDELLWDFELALSDECEYAARIVRKLRAVAHDRAYQHLLHEAMDQRRFRKPAEIELTWQRPVKRGDVTYMETCFV